MDTPPYSSLNFTARKEDVAATTREEMLTSVTKWKQELFAMNELAGDTGSAAIPKAFMSKYNKKMAIGGFDKPDTGEEARRDGVLEKILLLVTLTKC